MGKGKAMQLECIGNIKSHWYSVRKVCNPWTIKAVLGKTRMYSHRGHTKTGPTLFTTDRECNESDSKTRRSSERLPCPIGTFTKRSLFPKRSWYLRVRAETLFPDDC